MNEVDWALRECRGGQQESKSAWQGRARDPAASRHRSRYST